MYFSCFHGKPWWRSETSDCSCLFIHLFSKSRSTSIATKCIVCDIFIRIFFAFHSLSFLELLTIFSIHHLFPSLLLSLLALNLSPSPSSFSVLWAYRVNSSLPSHITYLVVVVHIPVVYVSRRRNNTRPCVHGRCVLAKCVLFSLTTCTIADKSFFLFGGNLSKLCNAFP